MGSIGSAELLIVLVILGGFLFWAWMLVDCAINEPSGTNKIVWILIILLAHFIGAAVYFVFRKGEERNQESDPTSRQ